MTENNIDTARLLFVSRDSSLLRTLSSVADSNHWQLESATSPWEAMERIQSGITPHLLLLDLPRGDGDSLHIIRWLRRLRPGLKIVVTCSAEDLQHRVEAIRLGAQEVVLKPFEEARLAQVIESHLRPNGSQVLEVASEDIEQLAPDLFFVSASPTTQKVRAQAKLLAEADVPVFIVGERGSGKDRVARLIHKLSVRSGFAFLKVNCAEMPTDLLDSELFGERLARNARTYSQGKIERAKQGTIYIDEIAEMSPNLQGKLLRVLQEKSFARPDDGEVIPADVRILAGSSMSIDRALELRKLREDLYYRLSAFTIQVPPLRERKGEISLLLQHSMHHLAKQYGLPPREFPPALIQACEEYVWPGNLNELEHFVKRYLVAGDKELSFKGKEGADLQNDGRQDGTDFNVPACEDNPCASTPTSLKSLMQIVKWEAERNAIGTALQKTGWNRKAAARLLKVSYRTLLYKIDQYQMSASESFASPFPTSNLQTISAGRDRRRARSD